MTDAIDIPDDDGEEVFPRSDLIKGVKESFFNDDALWNRNNVELAIALGTTAHFARLSRTLGKTKTFYTASQARTHVAGNRRARIVWSNWDWNARDAVLARDHDLSRQRIQQIRLLLTGKRENNDAI